LPDGTVIRLYSDFAEVAFEGGEIVTARFRGRLEHSTRYDRSPFAVGDRVSVALADGEAVIEARHPRRTKLSRAHPHQDKQEQIIAANVDRVLVVASAITPPLKAGLVDRYLVAASAEGMEAAICLTKCDLVDYEMANALIAPWRGVYPVFRTRVDWPGSIEALRPEWLAGHATVLVGQSGTGKTTLRNILLSGERGPAPTSPVSNKTGRGQHVTSAATFEPLVPSGFLVDTPGTKELGLWSLTPPDLPRHFPEFAGTSCKYPDCHHVEEPGCGLRAEVEAGRASAERLVALIQIAESMPRPGRR